MIRPAGVEEFAYLTERMRQNGGEVIDLWSAPCWVDEVDGVILGLLAVRPVWQFEPLLVFKEVKNKASRRRTCLGLYRAAEAWISDPTLNQTGVRRAFAITRMFAVRGWAKKLGWKHQYKRAPLWIKHF